MDNSNVQTLVVVLFDLLIINLFYFYVSSAHLVPDSDTAWFLWNLSYTIAVLVFNPMAQNRLARIEQVATRTFVTSLLTATIFGLYLVIGRALFIRPLSGVAVCVSLFALLFVSRMISRGIFQTMRRKGRNTRTMVFVGAGLNLAYLQQCMSENLSSGFRFLGYFDDHVSKNLGDDAPLLGDIKDVIPWLKQYRPHLLFCNLPSSRSEEILAIINYCENNFIRFYSVPNIRNYVHRAMEVEMIADVPVLKLRREPLLKRHNRLLKRLTDIALSLMFILTIFWWLYIIVAIVTKLTMPGPVFFRQKRNGLLGEEFMCLKFRSMKVNADSDKVQATKDDQRVTAWGKFLRKSSIDETPQFLNVLMGNMSIVGPRPHMVMHTVEYSHLIDKYMVRHWVKPGITGWAQVTGSRGETHELWQMEERIRKDVWYIENWSLWLDIRIIILTFWKQIVGDEQAY